MVEAAPSSLSCYSPCLLYIVSEENGNTQSGKLTYTARMETFVVGGVTQNYFHQEI